MAVSLSQVDRIEDISVKKIEISGDKEVIQYREHILPLVRVEKLLGTWSGGTESEVESHKIIVVSLRHNKCGLIVSDIIDIVEEFYEIEKRVLKPGIQGTALIQKRVTDFLDVEGLIRALDPVLLEQMQSKEVV